MSRTEKYRIAGIIVGLVVTIPLSIYAVTEIVTVGLRPSIVIWALIGLLGFGLELGLSYELIAERKLKRLSENENEIRSEMKHD